MHMLNTLAAYYEEQVAALEYIVGARDLSIEEKKRFFKRAHTNYGTSALCLSGGASFGYCQTLFVSALIHTLTPTLQTILVSLKHSWTRAHYLG